MSSPEEIKNKRVTRYKRLAIICAYLLALLWPLGSFFVWILLGAIVYFLFLMYYHSPRVIRPQGRTDYEQARRSTQSASNQARTTKVDKKTLGLVIVIITVAIIFIALVIALINMSSEGDADNSTSENNSAEEYQNALLANPNDTDALINLGNTFYSRNEYDSAMKYYERTLALDPSNSSGLHNKALVLQQQKKYSKSTEVIR
jgi:tetratricopeptide (TPR) repeat protein